MAGYRIDKDQSAGMKAILQPADRSPKPYVQDGSKAALAAWPRRVRFIADHEPSPARPNILLEHDLFRKPVPTPDQVRR
jgi:hypothetical protein